MKISVKLGASETTGNETFDLEDLGLTQEEWDLMSESEKNIVIENAVFEQNDQPYWMVDSFNEK